MAILKSALEESLLSKSEQAALRVLTRVAMLQDGLNILSKLYLTENVAEVANIPAMKRIEEFKQYLQEAIAISLLQHRLPANNQSKETTVSK